MRDQRPWPDYVYNSVGVQVSDEVENGTRTTEWRSDHPVKFFNVVAGRWKVKEGDGTAIYYYAGHPYNIDEMSEALDAARKYYSEWFMPYPWRRLKLSEFPALATLRAGIPDRHHVPREHRLPDQERSAGEPGVHGDRARVGPPVVGQHPAPRRRAPAATSCRRAWRTSPRFFCSIR